MDTIPANIIVFMDSDSKWGLWENLWDWNSYSFSFQASKCRASPIIWTHLAVLASWYHWKTEVADLRREGLVQQDMFYVEIVLYVPRSSQIMQKLNPSRNANGSANPLGPFEHFTLPPLCKISRNVSWESCRYIQLYNYPHDIVHCKYHTSKVTS